MSDSLPEHKTENSTEDLSPTKALEEKTSNKSKKSGSKRLSTLEKTAQEANIILKGLNSSIGEVDGRRRTRSSVRGIITPIVSPKKQKRESKTVGSRGRGRPKKTNENDEEFKVLTNNKNVTKNDTDDTPLEINIEGKDNLKKVAYSEKEVNKEDENNTKNYISAEVKSKINLEQNSTQEKNNLDTSFGSSSEFFNAEKSGNKNNSLDKNIQIMHLNTREVNDPTLKEDTSAPTDENSSNKHE